MKKIRWTDDDVKILEDNYPMHGARWVAEKLGRTVQSVSKKAYYLRVHKDGPSNLIGCRFGKWAVIKKSEHRSGNNTYWLCRCDCGNESLVQRPSLISGGSMQCIECSHKISLCGQVPHSYFNIIMGRAKRRDIPFDISIQDISDLYEQSSGKCSLSNLPIGFFDSASKEKFLSSRGHTASLDRIDSSLGYVVNNIQWVHRDINIMKNLFDQSLFIYLCSAVADNNIHEEIYHAGAPGWMQEGCSMGKWNRENG